jgi:hypothetical protein
MATPNPAQTKILANRRYPEYTKLDADPFPTPIVIDDNEELGAILEVSDTGDRYRWTGQLWVQTVAGGATKVDPTHTTTFGLELVDGRVPGKSFVRVFGRNPDLDAGGGFEALWEHGGTYTGFDAVAAETLSIVSTSALDTVAGTGAQMIRVEGLDINLLPVQENISLDGLTPVTTVNSYFRWQISFVLAAGITGYNQGVITGNQSTTVANVFFSMAIESNRALACVTTVPAGKIYHATNVFATFAKKGAATSEIKVAARLPGLPFQVFEWFAVAAAGSSYVSRDLSFPFLGIPEGTDILLLANSDTNNTGIAGGIEFIIEDA